VSRVLNERISLSRVPSQMRVVTTTVTCRIPWTLFSFSKKKFLVLLLLLLYLTLIHALTSALHTPSASLFDARPTDLPSAVLNKLQNKATSCLLHSLALENDVCVCVGGGAMSAFESFAIVVKSSSSSHYSWQLAWKKDRASLVNFMNYSIDTNLKGLAQDPTPHTSSTN